jgi:hypothetical protein
LADQQVDPGPVYPQPSRDLSHCQQLSLHIDQFYQQCGWIAN